MVTFTESNMNFEFADEDFYYIEKSPLLKQADGFRTCECIVKSGGKVMLIEAKSSTPHPQSKEKFDEFNGFLLCRMR